MDQISYKLKPRFRLLRKNNKWATHERLERVIDAIYIKQEYKKQDNEIIKLVHGPYYTSDTKKLWNAILINHNHLINVIPNYIDQIDDTKIIHASAKEDFKYIIDNLIL